MLAEIGLTMKEPDVTGRVGVIDAFLETDIAETTAVLHLMATLTPNDVQRAQIQRALTSRRQPMPPIVTGLADVTVTQSWLMDDELGDGDNYIIGIDWPGGEHATLVCYVEHNMGTIVKDAFFIPQPVSEVVEQFIELTTDAGNPANAPKPTDLADCRARIEQALTILDDSPYAGHEHDWHDDEEGTMWPQCRPLLEFVVSRMPTGGSRYAGTDADPDELQDSVRQAMRGFAQSAESAPLQDPADPEGSEARAEAALALLTTAAVTSADPLRWSPVTVEMCLADSLPNNPNVSEQALDHALTVLPALIRYAHGTRDADPSSTKETLDAVGRWTPSFLAARANDEVKQAREVMTDLASHLVSSGESLMLSRLHEIVGGAGALDALSADPLPDEALDLSDVPEDIHASLLDVSGHLDELVAGGRFPDLDVEFRTACRRFLAQAARSDPAVFRRRAKTTNTAAAIAWTVGRGNELVGYPPSPVRSGELMDHFGLSGPPSQRAETLSAAFGTVPSRWPGVALGSPDVLVSRMRSQLLARRDVLLS